MTKFLLGFLCLGGLLKTAAAFAPAQAGTPAVESLWIATDLSLVLGFVGLFQWQYSQLTPLSRLGFPITIASFALIAGPSASLGDITAYGLGAPLAGVGILLIAISHWRRRLLPRWISVLTMVAIVGSFVVGALGWQWGNTISGAAVGVAIAITGAGALKAIL